MNELAAEGVAATPSPAEQVAALPAPPFVRPAAGGEPPRFAPLSPRVGVLLIAAIALGVLLWIGRDGVRPFVVGLLLVFLLDIPVRWLTRLRVHRTIAIAIVYVLSVVLFIEFMALTLTPLINEILRFIDDLPKLVEQLNARLLELSNSYDRLEIPPAIRDWIDEFVAGLRDGGPVPSELDFSFLLPIVTGAGSVIGGIFGYLLLPVWVFYLLKDRVRLTASFDRAIPPAWRFDTLVVLRTIERTFRQWVRAQFVLGFTVGLFTFIGLLLLSEFVDPVFGRYAVLLSVVAGILELLPIIGPIIAAVPAVLLAITAGAESVIAVLVLYTVVQQVENNVLVPKIQGDAVELHPAAVMFAIVIGGALAGLLGAILALPVAAAGRDVVRYLFRRLGPEDPESLLRLVHQVGMGPPPVLPPAPNGAPAATEG